MQADRVPETSPDLDGEADSDLLVYMSMVEDDPTVAAAAWETFYGRHAEYLYTICLRAYAELLGGEAGVCDLVAETFKRAYENAGRFDANGIQDQERLRRRVRAWLGRIAQRIVQTMLRGRSKLPTRFLQQDHWQQVTEPPAAEKRESKELERVRAAVLSLTKREQMVVRVTMQWYQPDKQHQRLPNDVAADLATTLRTTPENLRQLRRRAMKKVEAYLGDCANDA